MLTTSTLLVKVHKYFILLKESLVVDSMGNSEWSVSEKPALSIKPHPFMCDVHILVVFLLLHGYVLLDEEV